MATLATLYVIRNRCMHELKVYDYPRVVRLVLPAPDVLGSQMELRKENLPPGVALTQAGAWLSLINHRRRAVRTAAARMRIVYGSLLGTLELLSAQDVGVLRTAVPQTYGDAISRYPWIECEPHEWDNRTTQENAAYLSSLLRDMCRTYQDDCGVGRG